MIQPRMDLGSSRNTRLDMDPVSPFPGTGSHRGDQHLIDSVPSVCAAFVQPLRIPSLAPHLLTVSALVFAVTDLLSPRTRW